MPISVPECPTDGAASGTYEVLYVDGSDGLSEVFPATLEREDDRFSVRVARDIDDALAHLDDVGVDCIVSTDDVYRQNDLDLLVEARDRDSTIPFVLLTGPDSENVATEAIAEGVTDCFDRDDVADRGAVLSNRIENAIRSRRVERRFGEARHGSGRSWSDVPASSPSSTPAVSICIDSLVGVSARIRVRGANR